MSNNFKCIICNVSFSAERSLINHQKNSQSHKKAAGESPQGFTCNICGRNLCREYDIPRHQQSGGCPGVQAFALQPTDTSNKQKHHADSSSVPNQRKRTTSPTRRYDSSDSALRSETSDCSTFFPWILEQAGAGEIPISQKLSQGADSSTTTSNPLPQDAADSSADFDTGLSIIDMRADIDLDEVQENTHPLPLTDMGAAGNTATVAPARSDKPSSPEVQVLPVNDDGDGIDTADRVESLTHVLERTSITMRLRSSFALSTVSGYSAASQTNSSVRSYLMNPSLKSIRLSWLSTSSRGSSNRSFRRASTVPSEMAAPMLDSIDEELENSRGSSNRLERYASLFRQTRQPKKVSQERLRIAVRAGVTDEVADILARGAGIIDVNCLDDRGLSLLITASMQGFDGIVRLLLKQRGTDVSYRDPEEGCTALEYARDLENSKVEKVFAAYSLSENIKRTINQDLDRNDDNMSAAYEKIFAEYTLFGTTDTGICCEMPPQPALAVDNDLQGLWQACERGDVVFVARLITELSVDPNSLNAHRRTPLSIAASHGHEALVRRLLEHDGVDVAIQDVNGATALTWAASRGHLEVVNMLLSSEPTTSRNHASRCAAWALARRKGHVSVAEVLIANL
jgi:ankyrin repeat protein